MNLDSYYTRLMLSAFPLHVSGRKLATDMPQKQKCKKLPKKSKTSHIKTKNNTIQEHLPTKKNPQTSYNFRNKNANESVEEKDQKCSFCGAFNPYVGSTRTCFSCGLKCEEQRTSTTFTTKPQHEPEVIDACSRTEALPFSHNNSTKDVHLTNTVLRSGFTKSRRVKAPVKYGQESSPLKRIKLRREIETDIQLINKTVIAEPKLNESSINETGTQVPKVNVPPKLDSKSCTPDIRSINDRINHKRAPVVDRCTKKSALEKDIELINKKQGCSRLFVPADVLKEITYDNSVREDAINADKSSSENSEEIIDLENIEDIPVVNIKNSNVKVCAAKMTHIDTTIRHPASKRLPAKQTSFNGQQINTNFRKRRHSDTNGHREAVPPPSSIAVPPPSSEAVPGRRVPQISSFIKTALSRNSTGSPEGKKSTSVGIMDNLRLNAEGSIKRCRLGGSVIIGASGKQLSLPPSNSSKKKGGNQATSLEPTKSQDFKSNCKNTNTEKVCIKIIGFKKSRKSPIDCTKIKKPSHSSTNNNSGLSATQTCRNCKEVLPTPLPHQVARERVNGDYRHLTAVVVCPCGTKQALHWTDPPNMGMRKGKTKSRDINIDLDKSANQISETPVAQPGVTTRSTSSTAKNQRSAEVSKKCTKPRPAILRRNVKRQEPIKGCDYTESASAKSSNFSPSNVILETDKATKSISPLEEAPVTLEISCGEEDSNATVTADSEDFLSDVVEDSLTPTEPIPLNPDDVIVTFSINSEIPNIQSQVPSQPIQANLFETPLPSPSVEEVTLQEDSQHNLSKQNNAFETNSAVFSESVLSSCSNQKVEEIYSVSTCYDQEPLTNHVTLAANNNKSSTLNIKYVPTLEQEHEDSLIIENDAALGPESVLSNHSEESTNEIEINLNKLTEEKAFPQIDSDETINNITVPLCDISKVDSKSVNAKVGEKEEWCRNEEFLCLLNTEFSTVNANVLSVASPNSDKVSTTAEPMYEKVELQPVESPSCLDSKSQVSSEVDKKSLNLNVHCVSVSKNAEGHGTLKSIIALPAINRVDSDSVEEEECSADEDFASFSKVSNTDTTDEFSGDLDSCMKDIDNFINNTTYSKMLKRRKTGLYTIEPQFGAPGIPNKRTLVETSNIAQAGKVRLEVLRSDTNLVPITLKSNATEQFLNSNHTDVLTKSEVFKPLSMPKASIDALQNSLNTEIPLASIQPNISSCLETLSSIVENEDEPKSIVEFESNAEGSKCSRGPEIPLEDLKESETFLKDVEGPEIILKNLESPVLGLKDFEGPENFLDDLEIKTLLKDDILALLNMKHSVIQNTLQELGERNLNNKRCQETSDKELEPSPTTPSNYIESIQHFSSQNSSQAMEMDGYSDCTPSLKRCLVTSIEGQQSIVEISTLPTENVKPTFKQNNFQPSEKECNLKLQEHISEECNTITQPTVVENVEPKLSSDRPELNVIIPALSNEYSFNSDNEAEKSGQGPDLNVNLLPTISIGRSSSSNSTLESSAESSQSNPITPAVSIDSFIPNFKSETGVKMVETGIMIPSDIVESTNPDLEEELSKESSPQQQDSMTKEHHETEPMTQSSEQQKSSECNVEAQNSSRKEHPKTYLGIESVESQESSLISPVLLDKSTYSEFEEEASKECTQQQEYSSRAPAIVFESIDSDFEEQCSIEKLDNRKNVHNGTLSLTSLESPEPSSSSREILIKNVALDSGNDESRECSFETQNSRRKEHHLTDVSISNVENPESIVRDTDTLIEGNESELEEPSKHCILEKPEMKMIKCLSIEPSVETQEFSSRGPAVIGESTEIRDNSLDVQEDSDAVLEKLSDTPLHSEINLSESLPPNKSSEEASVVLGKCSPVTTSNFKEDKFCDKRLNQGAGELELKDLHVDTGCNATHELQTETVPALGKRPHAEMDEMNGEREKLCNKKQKHDIDNQSFDLSASNSNAIVHNGQNLSTGLESKVSEKVDQLVEMSPSEEEPLPIQIDSYCSMEQPSTSMKFPEETFVQVGNRPTSSESPCNNQQTAHHHSDSGTFSVPRRLLDQCSASGQQELPKGPNIGVKKSRKKPEDCKKTKKPSYCSTNSSSGLPATQTCRKCQEVLPTPLPHQVACERVDRDCRHLTADVVCPCGAKQALHWTDPPNMGGRKGKTKPRDSVTGKQLLPRPSTTNSSNISALFCAQKCRWCGEELPVPLQNQFANRQVMGACLYLTSLVDCRCGAKQARHDIVSKKRLADLAARQHEDNYRREKQIEARRLKKAEHKVKNLYRAYGMEDPDAPLANVETHPDATIPRNCSEEGNHYKVPCRDSSSRSESLAGSESFPDDSPTCERTLISPITRSVSVLHSPDHPSDKPAVVELVEDMSTNFDLFERGTDSYKCARADGGPCEMPMAKKDIAAHFFSVHHESKTAFNVLFLDPT